MNFKKGVNFYVATGRRWRQLRCAPVGLQDVRKDKNECPGEKGETTGQAGGLKHRCIALFRQRWSWGLDQAAPLPAGRPTALWVIVVKTDQMSPKNLEN